MKKQFLSIFIRYIILLAVAIPNLYLFYLIFTPLTTNIVYLILNLFYGSSLIENTITIIHNNLAYPIEIIPACVAGSAYYLLLILNLSTSKIKFNKRILMIIASFLVFFIINVLRIVLLTFFHISNSNLFNIAHQFFWYFLSIIFVIIIWFAQVKLQKIKSIPFYSDINLLYNKIKK